jgi:protein gp37
MCSRWRAGKNRRHVKTKRTTSVERNLTARMVKAILSTDMAKISSIEWTQSSWNPLTGCTKISEGCRHCYAERLARRLQGTGNTKYIKGFELTLHPGCLEEPTRWKESRRIFVCSMGDLFHEAVPEQFIQQVFAVMNKNARHNFQVLTKRANRLEDLAKNLVWTKNIWAGVTVESSAHLDRIHSLKHVPASIRFLSLEPLLSSVSNLALDGIDWVIVGGESGTDKRPLKQEWVTQIRDKCIARRVPFFFKQWGGYRKKNRGRLLEGRTWDEIPKTLP